MLALGHWGCARVREAEESAPKIEALRERLLSEARSLCVISRSRVAVWFSEAIPRKGAQLLFATTTWQGVSSLFIARSWLFVGARLVLFAVGWGVISGKGPL